MSLGIQLEIFPEGAIQALVEELLRLLRVNGWLTRRQIKEHAGWAERTTRAVAEAAGVLVVRGPRGYNVLEACSVDEILHAAQIMDQQGTKMKLYAAALRKRAHERVG